MINSPIDAKSRGFSILEMTIVLVVVGLLASGLLKGLAAQREQARINEAKSQLNVIREALIGFILANGRLPCPGTPDLPVNAEFAGLESPACASECPGSASNCPPEHGVVPWQTLGVAATDPWGNRLTYFADRNFSKPLSAEEIGAGQRNRIGLDAVGRASIQERAGTSTLSNIPAIVVSHGLRAQGAYGGDGIRRNGATGDEAENADDDLTFIYRLPDEAFDDLLTWLPTAIIKARLASVGKLP